MSRTPVTTENAPKALPGIYSQAIVANGFVYCSGCVPMDPKTMKLIDGDIQAHTVSTKANTLHIDHDTTWPRRLDLDHRLLWWL